MAALVERHAKALQAARAFRPARGSEQIALAEAARIRNEVRSVLRLARMVENASQFYEGNPV